MNGIIFYRGPSVIDGKPIVAIATGLRDGGANSKTGPMAQIYFIRSDVNPMVAVHTGDDVSICGDCSLRGEIEVDKKGVRKNVRRKCYVTLMHGPRVVYDAFLRGVYPEVKPAVARKLLAGKRVRLGSYGDPGSVPFETLETVLDKVHELNGYTHMWRKYPELSAFCMASCDTEKDREEAKALGFRTYRIRRQGDPVLKGEGQCPASAELGKKVQCASCMLCGGHKTKAKADLTIVVHGGGATHFA